ncbi:uncharacterized protein LOC117638326 [Prunus dulcis]|uniref:uncharacterized protein LOC117638326 n=1 Tax=Prunus dulcis TaxID=3755 RepID=UPI0014821F38|nr:uncharacterized protein LOC117638326 [Prunus dulcis]
MSAQLNASSSLANSRSPSPKSDSRWGNRSIVEPSVVRKGRFTFRMDRNETKVSTTALDYSVQSHYETFCLVGKIFGVPVNSRVIRHILKSEWKNMQGEVTVDHIGRDWYKVEFTAEEDVVYVLENRPWFVLGQIFALQRWTPDFSPFHAIVTSIVGWVRIPFLPLHCKDPEVLHDLVSIRGDPIGVDLQSTEGKQSMFVRVRMVLDLTRPLKRCLVLGKYPQETKIFVSYDALFAICFYCSQKMEWVHECPIKISNKSFLQVERLDNEPNVLPRALVLGVEEQEKLAEDVTLVFPQPITVDSFYADKNSDYGEKMPTKTQDPEWTVVANRKEEGGSLAAGAKGQGSGLSSKGHGKAVMTASAQSQEGSSAFTAFAYKSPKKRARDEDVVKEDSLPSVGINGESLREADTSVPSGVRAEAIAQRLGFAGSFCIPALEYHERFIHCHLHDIIENKHWKATFIYAYPQKHKQKQLWNDILDLKPGRSDAWLLMGDFNNICTSGKKIGGSAIAPAVLAEFNDFINLCEVISLSATGVPFTWCNGHKDASVIYERLDRVLVNPNWLNLYPNCVLQNLPIIRSDHGPISLSCTTKNKSNNSRSFKFEAMWLSHPDFPRIFNQAWNVGYLGNASQQVHTCFQTFQHLLKKWNREEEVFYAQKARSNWLNLGDKNMKYFHTQALIRRKRNQILKLKDCSGIWVEGESLNHLLVDAFKKRFTASNVPSLRAIKNYTEIIQPCISASDNDRLLAPVYEEELFEAIKSIGALKAPGPDGVHAIFYQNFWDQTKHPLKSLVDDFFNHTTCL